MQCDLLYPSDYKQKTRHFLSEAAVANLELEYLAGMLCPYNMDYALKVLSELVTDIEVIRYRQDVLRDFMNVPQLEGILYKSLHTVYQNSRSVYAKVGSTQSFFEISENLEHIESFISCIRACHEFYEKCYDKLTSKGARELARALEEKYAAEEFSTLVSETKKLKEVLENGIKSVTFAVNLDELMRPSEVALISVSREPFRKKKLFEKLFSKGETTEPLSNVYSRKSKEGAIVAINERLFAELDELGGEYTKHFNTALSAYFSSSISFLTKLEPQINFYVGVMNMVNRAEQMGLPVCIPEILPSEKRVFDCGEMYDLAFACKLYTASSFVGKLSGEVKTNSCKMDEDEGILILTGSNNGGKTTFTRAAGINQVLAQCGLCVGAETAQISMVDELFVHFPREEEVGINASRFTEECKEFRSTTEKATQYSMVLMNESLSSTTPSECLMIAEELMKIFSHIGVRLIYTTHIHDLIGKIDEINALEPKSRLCSMTAQCDESGKPTYRITKGFTDDSHNARYIFSRFGISYEEYLKGRAEV